MADKILATLTSKGQITLPVQHRKAWGLSRATRSPSIRRGGNRFASSRGGSGVFLERLDELKLPSLGRPLTQKDIDEFNRCRHDREIWRAGAQEGKVIGIDTNILLRIFETKMILAQSLRARKAIEDNAPVYLHDVVLAEFVWTCSAAFKQSRQAIHQRLQAIAQSTEFVVARPEVFERAVEAYGSQKSDFADWLIGISNLEQGLEYTLTFDKGAARRRAFGMVDP